MTDGERRFKKRIDQLYSMDTPTLRQTLGKDLGKVTAESDYWLYREIEVAEKILNHRRYALGDPEA